MKAKLKLIIPIAAAVIAIIIAAVCITFVPKSSEDISSLMSTAQKYLVEQDYEQALAEFSKVIKLDPMNVDAYLGLADAYIGMGDTDSAVEWLEKGYEITGDERLKELFDSLGSHPDTTTSTTTSTTLAASTTNPTEEAEIPIQYFVYNDETGYTEKSYGDEDEKWLMDYSIAGKDIWSKVDRVEAVMYSDGTVVAGMGGNDISGNWIMASNNSDIIGRQTLILDDIGGLISGPDGFGNERGYFKFEWWWADSYTFASLESVILYDEDGNVLVSFLSGSAATDITAPEAVVQPLQYNVPSGEYYYNVLADNSVELIDYVGNDWELVIPSTVDGKNVTSIRGAFNGCDTVSSIIIPGTVTNIEEGAFYWCWSVTSITIPNGVKNIGSSAFRKCGRLVSVTIPDSVTSIGWCAFAGCMSLTSATIPDSVTSIGDCAFAGCDSLTSITIPDSVTSISKMAFDSCYRLNDVYYSGTVEQWNNILIETGNDYLLNATLHTN